LTELWTILEITAYTAGFESCQKHPDDPLYGITYSGNRVKEWHTVAAGPDIPIGTRIFIPELADKPNGGMFVVEDRGGAISNAHLDIYMDRLQDARNWGRQHLEVLLWLPKNQAPAISEAISRDRQRWKDKNALKKLFP
jgi:3D (Asp-Asp-Asp) domain-containing protein